MQLTSLFVGALGAVGVLSASPVERRQAKDKSMGFIGCSMAENVAQGYVGVDGKRMWGPYGTSGMVVQSWTDNDSNSWKLFDQQVSTKLTRRMFLTCHSLQSTGSQVLSGSKSVSSPKALHMMR